MRRVFAEARRLVAEWEGRIVLIYMASRLYQVRFKPDGYRVAADAVLEYPRHDIPLAFAGADSPRGIHRGHSPGHVSPPRYSKHKGRLVAPGEPARSKQPNRARLESR